MHILVTGAAGFIGARTTEMLLESGHSVVGLDNLNDYYDVRLKEYRISRLRSRDGFSFHCGDVEEADILEKIFAGNHFDAVINLAARAGVRASIENPGIYLRTNTGGMLQILECMVRHKVAKLVIASTSSLYAGQPMPFTEDAVVTRPISPYAATKLAAEALCYVWHHLHGIDVSILRYFTVYGPAGRPDMAPFRFSEWIRRGQPITLYGDGKQTRDFTFIDDIARGTIAALRPLGYEIINLGGGNAPLSINGMIQILEKEIRHAAVVDHHPAIAADMSDTAADVNKAARLLGWNPAVMPEKGLAINARWHLEHSGWLDGIKL